MCKCAGNHHVLHMHRHSQTRGPLGTNVLAHFGCTCTVSVEVEGV